MPPTTTVPDARSVSHLRHRQSGSLSAEDDAARPAWADPAAPSARSRRELTSSEHVLVTSTQLSRDSGPEVALSRRRRRRRRAAISDRKWAARRGTTWLANRLIKHNSEQLFNLVCVQHLPRNWSTNPSYRMHNDNWHWAETMNTSQFDNKKIWRWFLCPAPNRRGH